MRAAHHEALEGGRQRAQDAAHAHLGAQQAQLAGAGVGKLEVVDAHDAHATRVDDLLVEQVTGDEDLVGLQVGEADVGGGDGEADLVVIEVSTYLRHEIMNGDLPGPWKASEVTRGKTSRVAMPRSLTTPIFSPLASRTGLPRSWDR